MLYDHSDYSDSRSFSLNRTWDSQWGSFDSRSCHCQFYGSCHYSVVGCFMIFFLVFIAFFPGYSIRIWSKGQLADFDEHLARCCSLVGYPRLHRYWNCCFNFGSSCYFLHTYPAYLLWVVRKDSPQ